MAKMKKGKLVPCIIFLNQVAGPLFWDLAEGLAEALGPCIIYTGQKRSYQKRQQSNLYTVKAPSYKRDGHLKRLLSWVQYFLFVLYKVWQQPRNALLFIVSNPPFLPLLGYLMRRMRRQPYVVLVYDIYPDIAICVGRLSERGIIARLWRYMNKIVWENAEIVFTIGEHMARQLESMFDSSKTRLGHVVVISNWADRNFIRPLPKSENWFAQKHGQRDKLTVLYSGNLGAIHDLETILAAAKHLQYLKNIHFLIIGEGFKKKFVAKYINSNNLTNVTLLPLQPEVVLPYSLATGDVAVVSLIKGAEKLSFPSKVFYAMASGAAILCICAKESDLWTLVERHKCGICVEPGDIDGCIYAIMKFYEDKNFLVYCRRNARKAIEIHYNIERNIKHYLDAINHVITAQEE